MEIKFIGTGSGKTSLHRFHSSLLLTHSGNKILIDAGDSVSRALLSSNENILSINSILFTHFHSDHFAGLPSLLTQMKLLGRETDLVIYTMPKSSPLIRETLKTFYLYEESFEFSIILCEFKLSEWNSINENLSFYPLQNSHISNKLNVSYDQQFISVSLCFSVDDKAFVYSSDIGSKNDLYLLSKFDADLIILESTHITTDDIVEFVKTSNCDRFFLTHIPDEYEDLLTKFVNKFEGNNVKLSLAFDGLKINI